MRPSRLGAFAAVPLLAAVTACTDPDPLGRRGFALSPSIVPVSDITASDMPRDGLPVLDDPFMLSAGDDAVEELLVPSDRVIGIELNGQARAYPLRLMRWHELANDTFGGVPIVVSYSPLADAVTVATRAFADVTLSFGATGLLVDSVPLLYDRSTSPSLWHPLAGLAITGPRAGQRLELLPADLVTWGTWLELHPESEVLAPVPALTRRYKRDPYHSYFGSDLLRFPVDPLPPGDGLALKDRVVVVTAPSGGIALALPHLADSDRDRDGTVSVEAAGIPLTIDVTLAPATARVRRRDDGSPLPVRFSFWFAWYATERSVPSGSSPPEMTPEPTPP